MIGSVAVGIAASSMKMLIKSLSMKTEKMVDERRNEPMSEQKSGLMGVLLFTLGGTLLLYGIYQIAENTNKPWINKELFTMFFVLPIGLAAFFLLGYGLLHIVKSREVTVTLRRKSHEWS